MVRQVYNCHLLCYNIPDMIREANYFEAVPVGGYESRGALRIREVDSVKLFGGGLEEKAVLAAEVDGELISYIERRYDALYVENWLAMRSAGLPVVPDLLVSSRDTLLVTDVKADGSE